MLPRIGLPVLALSALALAQGPMPPGMNPNGPQNGANSSGSSTAGPGGLGRMTRAASGALPGGATRENSPLSWISGRVILSGTGESGANILVQRVCGTAVIGEVQTDSTGHFSLPRADPRDASLDASNSTAPALGGCELRASFAGYQTGGLALGNGRSFEGADILIMLRPLGVRGGMTISATTLLAPKSARRSYEKGLDAMRRNQPDLAQKEFGEAVRTYPRYAEAWLELGKVYEQRSHWSDARNAYAKAIACDGEFLFPYSQLYRMDVRESRWQDAADASSKVMRLDPYEFPEAYYFNAVSNLALNHLDAAERSAREVTRLEGPQAEPRGNYLLGLVLWRKGDLEGAEEKFYTFLAASSGSAEAIRARRILADIQKQELSRQIGPQEASETEISSPPDAAPDR
jgi:tetratricopeptide (TPR) repeat protein